MLALPSTWTPALFGGQVFLVAKPTHFPPRHGKRKSLTRHAQSWRMPEGNAHVTESWSSFQGHCSQTLLGTWVTLLVCLFLSSPVLAAKWSGTHIPKRSLDEAVRMLRSGSSPLPMAKYPDPMLRMSASPVAESMFRQAALQQFSEALQATAATEGAVGLAASQVGVDARVIVLDPSIAEQTVFINPQVIERSSEDSMRWWREQCLVLPPDVLVTLLRDATIKVQAFDVNGKSHTVTLGGEAARAFQHELDHLNGVLIIDHAVDEDDLTSHDFPEMKDLEEADHPWRQEIAFARQVGMPT